MQEITIKALDKIHNIICPSNWHELTLEQLIEIESTHKHDLSVLKAFSILTGISLEITSNIKGKSIEKKVNQVVSFLQSSPKWNDLPLIDILQVEGIGYKIPKKIGDLMLGQKIMLTNIVTEDSNIMDVIPKVIAIIMQPYIDKKANKNKLIYSHERVSVLQKKILKSDALTCYSLATFFFRKLRNTIQFGMKDLIMYQSPQPKMRRLSQNWLKQIDLKSTAI